MYGCESQTISKTKNESVVKKDVENTLAHKDIHFQTKWNQFRFLTGNSDNEVKDSLFWNYNAQVRATEDVPDAWEKWRL